MPTLILEDGSKPANANSYCSVEFADTYHELMSNSDWAALPEDQKVSYLIKATESIDLQYADRYMSFKWSGIQALHWPRHMFVDNFAVIRALNTIPTELQKAVAVHALNLANAVVEAIPVPVTERVKKKKTKLGEIETDTEYYDTQPTKLATNYEQVELLLAAILKKKPTNIRMGR